MLRARLLLAASVLPLLAAETAPNGVAVNLDSVLRLTFERNSDILTARERVNESQIALNAALQSCLPEMLRKDTFKKPVAEAELWRRRVDLRKKEHATLQDAANTYFDWLTAQRGEAVARDLLKYEEKLLDRAKKLAKEEAPFQVVVEAIETAVADRRLYIRRFHQQSEAAAAKLAYLLGNSGGTLSTNETLTPLDRVDTTVPAEALVRQAQDNGPGVRELQGLIVSIQQSIAEACRAQRLCVCTGAALVCGRLQMAQSQLQQAQLALVTLQQQLRASVEEAFTSVHSGHEQLELATKAINHAKETYRIMDLRVNEESTQDVMRNKTYDGALNSIRQLTQAHSDHLKAVSDYNKAQMRLLLLLSAPAHGPAHTP